MKVLLALSFSHMLNDTIQSLLPAIYPLLKTSFQLSFTQIGLITLTFQLTASLLQPLVGIYTDQNPKPYSLAVGMGVTLGGLVLLARAPKDFQTMRSGRQAIDPNTPRFFTWNRSRTAIAVRSAGTLDSTRRGAPRCRVPPIQPMPY